MSGVNVEAEDEPAGGREFNGRVGEGGGVVVALRYFPSRGPRVRVGLTHLGAGAKIERLVRTRRGLEVASSGTGSGALLAGSRRGQRHGVPFRLRRQTVTTLRGATGLDATSACAGIGAALERLGA